jgi:riboflavin biosynthesis pyrimidine reductase
VAEGGGEIFASFLDEGEIDELIISVVPTFIGEGIPLTAPLTVRCRGA